MEKKSLILLIILGIFIAAIPIGYYIVQNFINDTIEDADVTVNSIELTTFTEDSMQFNLNYSFSVNTPVEATFRLTEPTVLFKGVEIGNVSLANEQFSTAQPTGVVAVTLNVTNATVYDDFINTFINNDTLQVDFSAVVVFEGLLASVPSKTLEKTITVDGMNGLSPIIDSFNLIDTTTDELIFSIDARIYNPSQLTASLDNLWIDLSYEGCLIGNATEESYSLEAGNNSIVMNATLGGNTTALENILKTYIMGEDIEFDLAISTDVEVFGGEFSTSVETDLEVAIAGLEDEIIGVNDIDISVTIVFITTYDVTTNVNISINNPMPFNITINGFTGDIEYDDSIGLGDIDLSTDGEVQSYPLEVQAESSVDETLTLHPTIGLTEGAILVGAGNPIYVDIKNGILDLNIGTFHIVVENLLFEDIEVPVY